MTRCEHETVDALRHQVDGMRGQVDGMRGQLERAATQPSFWTATEPFGTEETSS